MVAEEQIDALDWAILEDLQDDGRRSYREIGKRLGVAPATVRSRVMQMMDDGVVEIVAVPNPWKLGIGFYGTVALHIDPDQIETVAQLMAEREETSWVGVAVTGCDVMVEIALTDVQEFSWYRQNVLANLPGYRDADVFLVSEVRKMRYRLHSKSHEQTAGAPASYDDDAAG